MSAMIPSAKMPPHRARRGHWAHWGWARLVAALATILWVTTAQAQSLPEAHLYYEAYWGGAHVADFTFSQRSESSDADGGTYESRFHLETRGMTRWLTDFSAVVTTRGRWLASPNGSAEQATTFVTAAAAPAAKTHLPGQYRSRSVSSKHLRWVDIDFPHSDQEPGEPAHATTGTKPNPDSPDNWNPKDAGPEKLEKVSGAQRIAVMDPLSAAMQLMVGIEAHLGGGPQQFIIKGFDGRRRFNLNVEYLGPATRTVNRKEYNTYHVRVMPEPIAGFKKRHRKLWTGAAFDFYLLRDGSFMPVQISPVKYGPVISLIRRCDKPCELKADD